VTQDLTTRDIFQQFDSRVSRVEEDLRSFRTEVNSRFDGVGIRFDGVNQRFDSVDQRFDSVDQRLNQRFDAADQRFDAVDQRLDRIEIQLSQANGRFGQQLWRVIGLVVVTWLSLIGSIWLKM